MKGIHTRSNLLFSDSLEHIMTNEYVLLVSIYLFLYMDNQNIRYLRKCKVACSLKCIDVCFHYNVKAVKAILRL